MVGFCSTLLLRQARGTSVPPVGSEDLTWGMAATAMPKTSKHQRCLPAADKTYQLRDEQPRQPQARAYHQACDGENGMHGGPFENAFHPCHVILIVSLPCETPFAILSQIEDALVVLIGISPREESMSTDN